MVFAKCLEAGESVGAYKKTENGEEQLVSWAMQYQRGCIAHVYTLEEYRKGGLAITVVHKLCERLRAKGETPYAEVEGGNHVSNGLFQKLGFKPNQASSTMLGNFEPSCPWTCNSPQESQFTVQDCLWQKVLYFAILNYSCHLYFVISKKWRWSWHT